MKVIVVIMDPSIDVRAEAARRINKALKELRLHFETYESKSVDIVTFKEEA